MRIPPLTADKLHSSSEIPPCLLANSCPLLPGIPRQTTQLITMVLKGHCLCKAVTYTVDVDEPLITGYDHCDDCQRQSGSTYCKFHITTWHPSLSTSPRSLLTWQFLARELESFGRRHRGAGNGGPPTPASLDAADGAKLSHDPCPKAGAPPKGRGSTVWTINGQRALGMWKYRM